MMDPISLVTMSVHVGSTARLHDRSTARTDSRCDSQLSGLMSDDDVR